MSGHSKWANIKHRKARTDAKKGKIFSKIVKEIIVATKAGGWDPSGNNRLRTAIEKAKAENVPNDNIEKAIKKGTGELKGENYEEFFYEGYGAGGVAVLVSVATDNRNRTASEVRHTFTKSAGRLGESGSVAWIFENKGLIAFDMDAVTEDTLIDVALNSGALDVATNEDDKMYEVYTDPGDFDTVKEAFDSNDLKYNLAETCLIPKNTIRVKGKEAKQVLRLMDELEDLDDVQSVSANFEISADEMEGST